MTARSALGARFSAIVFDLDGTLVDSYAPIAESLNAVREAFGLPPRTLEEVRREVGRGLESLIRENVGEEGVQKGVALFRARYRRVFKEGTRLLPGVAATILELGRRGIAMAVTSNKPAYFSREIVDALGLEGRFAVVMGPEMVAHPKPDPEMVLKAMEILGRSADEVLYVGDMKIDVETARNAGIAVCAIPSGSEPRASLEAAAPDILIDRFEELLDFVAA